MLWKILFVLWIRIQHWRRPATDGAEFWISCKRPAFLSSFSRLQVIQNKRPWCSAVAYVIAGLLKRLRCEWTTQYIDPPPQSFEDAIEVYKSLPGKSLEDERVVSFSIAPLSEYCGAIDEIINSISDQNIEFVTNMLVDFEAVDKVLRRLKATRLASDFQTYRSILLDLERRFDLKRSTFIYRIQGRVDWNAAKVL